MTTTLAPPMFVMAFARPSPSIATTIMLVQTTPALEDNVPTHPLVVMMAIPVQKIHVPWTEDALILP